MQAQVAALVVNMAAGRAVTAADVLSIVSLYNSFVAHYHTASDLRGADTFGNLPVYGGGTYVTSTSASPTGYTAGTPPAGISSNTVITAADINVIITFVNSARVHTHVITDVTA